jgi:RimJ/RimL family protein N-acetyltransferase
MRCEMNEKIALKPGELKFLVESPEKNSAKVNMPDYHQQITLLDGRKAMIRPISCDDRNELLAFHSRLSEDTRFLRYHYLKGALTEEDLNNFCDMDYHNSLALVAEMEKDGHPEIIGVGRYFRLPVDHTAEVAFVVEDDEQNKGIGTQLLKHLAILAYQQDIHHFVGEVLRQNGRMLSIFRKSDPGMGQEVDSPCTCNISISVAEARDGEN